MNKKTGLDKPVFFESGSTSCQLRVGYEIWGMGMGMSMGMGMGMGMDMGKPDPIWSALSSCLRKGSNSSPYWAISQEINVNSPG